MAAVSRMFGLSNVEIILILVVLTISIIITRWIYKRIQGRAMVIVEPRKHKLLKYVCENFDKNMCKSWDLYVFHGKSHSEFAREAVEEIKDRKVFLIPLDTDNLTADQYNELFKKLDFWDQVKAEDILVFQTDAVLCPNSSYKIDDFTHFDYIGCSIFNGAIGKDIEAWGTENSFYGIGGLSFRKNSFQKQCIRKYPNITAKYPEDVFYSNCVEDSPNKPSSGTDLANFCSQTQFRRPSFGAHKITLLEKEHLAPFLKFCPTAKEMLRKN